MTEDDEVNIHFLPSFLPLPTHFCDWSASIIPYCTYQRCRIELRDDMMDEDGQVSWPGLQQVDALEGATISVNLTEEERSKKGGSISLLGRPENSLEKLFSSDRQD